MKKTFKTDKDYLLKMVMPESTETYKPVSNESILEKVFKNIDKYGLKLRNEEYLATGTKNDDGQCIGKYVFENDSEMGMTFCFRNSYNKTRPFSVVGGSTVFVCLNGMFSGGSDSYLYSHRHTSMLPEEYLYEINHVFASMKQIHNSNVECMEMLKCVELVRYDMRDILGCVQGKALYDGNAIFTSVQWNRFMQEMCKSKNFKTVSDGMTAWDLYNHGTEALKSSSPNSFFEKHIDWHNLVVKLAKNRML